MDTQAIFNHFIPILEKITVDALEEMYECDTTQPIPRITLSSGVYRGAIIDEDYDWILKFDLHDDECCAREEELYAYAREEDLEAMFAECAYAGYWEGYVFYAYPKADCSYCARKVTPEEHNKLTPYRHSPLKERGESLAADLLQIWGEEKFAELSRFCSRYSIDDLHGGNVGYIAGKLVLTDYAGAPSTDYYESEKDV
jgi:hypothetical protein